MNDILTVKVPGAVYRIHDPGGRIGRRLRTGKPYEHSLLDEIRRQNLKGSALDVGAHVGNHTLYLAIACGLKVHAFEANAERYKTLLSNLDLNPHAGQVATHPFAAGAGTGRGSWKTPSTHMVLEVGSGPVPVRAIDELVQLDDLAVVKIDIEGMEPQALEGMRENLKRCRPVIYSEVHTEQAHRAQAAVLGPLGYVQTSEIKMGSRMERWQWRGLA